MYLKIYMGFIQFSYSIQQIIYKNFVYRVPKASHMKINYN